MMIVSRRIARCSFCVFLLSPFLFHAGLSQHVVSDPNNRRTQADYVVITPEEYVPVVEPLASYRETENGLSVVIITSEAIYNIFGQGISPDSAVREFITFSQTDWEYPKPQFYLLAGNVNAVPSHKESGLEVLEEDSIMVDQWFVEGLQDSIGNATLSAAIGRLPGWDALQLAVMIDKTIVYESMADSAWHARSVFVADYSPLVGTLFETQGQQAQEIISPVWTDTIMIHLREDSPLHRTREEFWNILNGGSALVTFAGYHEWFYFSKTQYFTTWDVDSLANGSRFPLWFLHSSQRFEKEDTMAIAVALLATPGKGAVGAIAPTGHTFANDHFDFFTDLLDQMSATPQEPIGTMLLSVKRLGTTRGRRIAALLADPALVVRSSLVTGVDDVPPAVPAKMRLYQNYPNPFNPTTTIRFDLPAAASVELKVFNILGEEVATLVSGRLEAGTHTVQWDATRQPSGVYFYTLRAGSFVETKKLVLMR